MTLNIQSLLPQPCATSGLPDPGERTPESSAEAVRAQAETAVEEAAADLDMAPLDVPRRLLLVHAHPVDMERIRIAGRYYGSVYGGTLPAQIWRATMRPAVAGTARQDFPAPPAAPQHSATKCGTGQVGRTVNAPRGRPASPADEQPTQPAAVLAWRRGT